MKNTIDISGLRKSYGGRVVNSIPKLTLGTHSIEGLIGPNGAGKTTLLSLITGRVTADAGQVTFQSGDQSVSLSNRRLDDIARLGVVRTNQRIQDFESLTIMDSMLLCLANDRQEKILGLFKEKALRTSTLPIVQEYIEEFHFSNPNGHALSAGEKKLLDIIRCILLKPKFLLMDEPTGGLPNEQTEMVIDLVRKVSQETGMSVVIIEHDLDLIWNACEYVHFLSDGEVLFQGTPDEVRTNEVVRQKYMGE
ncbi:MAG: ATP-binding cassette domain-containing protein [Pseudomonadota bacterium]